MANRITDLREILRCLRPELHDGVWVFACLPAGIDPGRLGAIALVREAEGTTVVVDEATARHERLEPLYRAAWITLTVSSDLAAVGLTALVSSALAEAGISCNVLAAAWHDHLFVPVERGAEAIAVLRRLQESAASDPVGGR